MVTLQKEMGDGRGSPQEFLLKVGNLFLLATPAPLSLSKGARSKTKEPTSPRRNFLVKFRKLTPL